MRFRVHQHPPTAKINVTPLIDVVMVLIIFYLIVGKLAAERQGHVQLPSSAVGVQAETHDPVIVTIEAPAPGAATPQVLVNGHTVPEGSLESVLRTRVAADPGSTIVQIRADRHLPYSDVAPVIKACRDAGLVTEKSAGGGA